MPQGIVRQVEHVADKTGEVFFDAGLVLRGRRDDARVGDRPIRFEPIAMREDAA